MPRIPKTHIEGGLYYITSRGDNNEDIFKCDDDFKNYLRLLRKYKDQYSFKLYAFVLMPNHLHLLVELKEGLSISNILHDLHSSYTKYFNAQYQRKGHVFQERYKMVLAEKESNLLPLSAFIHLNPRASQSGIDAFSYPYSSCRFLCSETPVDTDFPVLKEEGQELQSRAVAAAAVSYREFVEHIQQPQMQALSNDLSKKFIIGSADFIAKVNQVLEDQKKQPVQEAPEQPRSRLVYVLRIAGVALILGLSVFILFVEQRSIKSQFTAAMQKKDMELSAQLSQQRELIKKDLNEKYKADLVSFQALSQRLEIERKRSQELEQKMEKKQ